MPIFFLLSLAIVFTIANRLFSKYTLDKHNVFSLTLLTNIVSALLVLPFVWKSLAGVLDYSGTQIMLIVTLGLLWSAAAWMMNVSISLNDFSFKEVIRQTRVIFVVCMGIFFLDETLTFGDVLGIGTIIFAVLLASPKRISFHEHITSKPLIFAWGSSVLIAAITIFEKILLNTTSALVYTFFAFLLPSIFLLVFMNRARLSEIKILITEHTKDVVIFSTLMLCAYYFGIASYQALPISIAYPVIQSATIFSVIIGTIIFEEKKYLFRKVIAACVAVIGIVLIRFL